MSAPVYGRPALPWVRPNPPPGQPLSLVDMALPIHLTDFEVPPSGPATRWQSGFHWAPESQAPGYLRDICDNSTLDAPALPTPAGVTATASESGGTLGAGDYSYAVVAVDHNGTTAPSTPVTGTISGSTGSVEVAWPLEAVNASLRGITLRIYGRVAGHLGLLVSGVDPGAGSWTDTGAGSPGAAPPVTNTSGGPGTYTNPAMREYFPFFVEVIDQCSSWGWQTRDFIGRATRLLHNASPAALAREFWKGTQAKAKSYPNDYLANADTCVDVTPTSVPSILRGVEVLEDALSGHGFGGQGMIHVQPQTTPSMLTVRRVGGQLLTLNDTVVVPDAGYDGSGPVGFTAALASQAYIYATDMVSAIIDDSSEPETYPLTMAEALDRGFGGEPNTVAFRAQWAAAAVFDGVRHFCCRVTLDV